jgi:cellulose synthase/poly-beta-1,6-N-acetylglucosamine synthase-like glycosyltransferase
MLGTILPDLLLTAAVMVAAPIAVLAVECVAAALPGRRVGIPLGHRGSVAVLVPAHDERALIGATIRSILPQLGTGDRLIVVTDNCTDGTARIAASAGATVVERHDLDRRGKGYALARGIDALRDSPPQVVIVCDADLVVPAGAIDDLARNVAFHGSAVQARYVLSAVPEAGPRQIVSSLAFLVKNVVRPAGLDRLGLPVALTGTGMAFPWAAISRAPLAGGDLVEDMRLGVHMLRAGFGARLCASVTIRGTLADSPGDALQQRKRWEHGHLNLLIATVLPLLIDGIRRCSISQLLAALDYSVPPLALLAGSWTGLFLTSLPVALKYGNWGPLWLNAATGCTLAGAVLLAWRTYGRHLPLRSVMAVPLYILWKLPLYAQFLLNRQTAWVRSARPISLESAALDPSAEA